MKLGTNDIGSVYLGTNAVQKVYLGTNEVWTSFTGLLDDYPNAAAAYSLRKLRSAYTGSAIRVRNSSSTELDIGFVNNVLDTTSLLSHCGSGDGFVTTWYDQSGNGYDASQTTAANQPQIVSSGSVIVEGSNPTLQFDGSNDYLSISSLASLFSGKDMPFGVFLISSTSSTSGVQNNLAFGNSSNNTPIMNLIRYQSNTQNAVYLRSSSISQVFAESTTGYSTNVRYLFSNNSSGTSGSVFRNNSSIISYTYSLNTITVNAAALGALQRVTVADYLMGKLQECIIYASDQSSNRTGIETNINTYYSIY